MPHLEDSYVLVPEGGASGVVRDELPEGVVRVTPEVLAARRLIEGAAGERAANADDAPAAPGRANAADVADASSLAAPDAPAKVQIAAFDFDGTSLSGNSPVMLVRYLVGLKMLNPSVLARIITWGILYKTRLPQSESWVRGLVFSAFRGKTVPQVNRFLRDFYRERVAPNVRAAATRAMQEHLDAGHVVVCVSATFEPILAAAMLEHPLQYVIATRMKVDAYGCYTREVEGLPVEGDEKIAALTRFADERFGAGKWELGWAYGDHHSDRTLLAAAREGFAVTPDRPLTRTAKEHGYQVLNWE